MALEGRRTKTGWALTQVPPRLYRGRRAWERRLYKIETLVALGLRYGDDPDEIITKGGMTAAECLWVQAAPDRVLNKGHLVE